MRIITLNANGIRSAARKGFFAWMQKQEADIICIQETKAQIHQLDSDHFYPPNYYCFYHDAEKKATVASLYIAGSSRIKSLAE